MIDKEAILDAAHSKWPYDLDMKITTKKAAYEAMENYALELLKGKYLIPKRKYDIGMWTMWAFGVAAGLLIGYTI